ncbi:DUF2497 domain-containing protein [Sphingomonas yunnanensis]|uniref:DUF2497 domain-containing protein n=1 Tax=Sphingomonas yunnanensis TaxID=310400 RepID=UPI001CA641F0|nr:DUF2497 domain-containing protein [Sphingomonas yunnanensis]MBY9064583.1 DUF2497 domain-containing protein [Sphingomonas yunnanensis]
MADLNAEPSMEDILASIKRVIKEGETQPTRRPAPRPLGGHDRDHVLELNDSLAAPTPPPEPSRFPEQRGAEQRAAEPPVPTFAQAEPSFTPPPSPVPAPAATVAAAAPEPAVSPATVEATRGALGALSRLVVKPEPDSDGTLEGLVRDMLRPMLSDWLDHNLPRLVEQMVAREIAKITSGQG